MAIACAGVTVTWNGTPFQEVREIRIEGSGSLPVGRLTPWSLDLGTIEVVCLGSANVSSSQYGKRYVLGITGTGGISWQSDCIYQTFRIEGVVNDATRYAVSFRVMDTNGAGSSPA